MRIEILLSCKNGAAWLPAFLDSLIAQTHQDWQLRWRDDGSEDETVSVLRGFAGGRCVESGVQGRLGVIGSFMALLREAPPGGMVAFADQDDVWLPEKLARAAAALSLDGGPQLYCARQILVDADLRQIGVSPPVHRPPALLTALVQNIVTGCTMVLNPAAARLLAESRPPAGTLHDWWGYLCVTAAGGLVVVDATPTLLYRQHGNNAVGAPKNPWARGIAALRRGPAAFMQLFRAHVAALLEQPWAVTPQARAALELLHVRLAGGLVARLSCLALPGLRRQTWYETFILACWVALG